MYPPNVIRNASEADLNSILHLFRETILHIDVLDYNKEQLYVWASSSNNMEAWIEKIHDQYFLLVEIETLLVGFASLTKDGCIDLLYVHQDFQRCGIASILLEALEKQAVALNLLKLQSDVSITAYPFFIKKGFVVVKEYSKQVQKEIFLNRLMEKPL